MAAVLQAFSARPALSRSTTGIPNGVPTPPVTAHPMRGHGATLTDAVLELADGTAFRGFSFGAEGKSIAGECVFQTGEFRFVRLSLASPELNSCDSQVWSDTPSR
jgi:hypothetical protein